MPAYVIVGADWHSDEALDAYVSDIDGVIEQFGGRYLVGTREVDVREGTWTPPIVAVLEFPTLAAARAWYESDEYARLLEIRTRGATCDLILVDGVDE